MAIGLVVKTPGYLHRPGYPSSNPGSLLFLLIYSKIRLDNSIKSFFFFLFYQSNTFKKISNIY